MAPTNAKTPTKSTKISAHNQKKSPRMRNGTITPIIKIVHVFAPTLVQTDVANFRALVQEMTGNDAASHSNKNFNTQAASDGTIGKDKLGDGSRMSKVQACAAAAHKELSAWCISSGASPLIKGGIKEERTCEIARNYSSDGEVSEYGQMESPSSCEHSVDSFFAESEEGWDHLYKTQPQQTYCSAYVAATATNWRSPLQEIPGGFESFDCF